MHNDDLSACAEKLANFFCGKEFEPVTQRTPYYHMGATITDAILQAGLNYQHVVYPRVLRLLTYYSEYRTTCDFLILMQSFPLSDLINWKNERKLQSIKELSWLIYNNGIEDENQLADWLGDYDNINQIRQIKGVGPKTVDYLKMLSGTQSISVDRHLFGFLELAGIFSRSYQEANAIYSKVSELLGISKYELDRKIWLYMSKGY
jgi:endonuclease III